MKSVIRFLRILLFALMLLLATFGVALPIPYYHREDPPIRVEMVEEEKELD
jgi:hypothetical protein